jgi:hypothetical protein
MRTHEQRKRLDAALHDAAMTAAKSILTSETTTPKQKAQTRRALRKAGISEAVVLSYEPGPDLEVVNGSRHEGKA